MTWLVGSFCCYLQLFVACYLLTYAIISFDLSRFRRLTGGAVAAVVAAIAVAAPVAAVVVAAVVAAVIGAVFAAAVAVAAECWCCYFVYVTKTSWDNKIK